MPRLLVLLSVAGVLGLALWRVPAEPVDRQEVVAPTAPQRVPVEASLEPAPLAPVENRVFDISVHTQPELELVLRRVEVVAQGAQSQAVDGRIVLVLHGPEVAFFSRKNYEEYRDLVDLAAKLSAFELIEVKMCQTMMKALDVHAEDVPAFIEQVPYGPAEVERLQQNGFVAM